MTDETTTPTPTGALARNEVTPIPKGGNKPVPAPKPAKAAKTTKATKAAKTTKKAPAPKKEGGVVRSASTVSKEGTQRDEFTGETLPVTAFPTVKQADGSYARGTVARKNLEAWRTSKKAAREAKKAEAAKKASKAPAAKKAAAAKKA